MFFLARTISLPIMVQSCPGSGFCLDIVLDIIFRRSRRFFSSSFSLSFLSSPQHLSLVSQGSFQLKTTEVLFVHLYGLDGLLRFLIFSSFELLSSSPLHILPNGMLLLRYFGCSHNGTGLQASSCGLSGFACLLFDTVRILN